MVGFWIRSKGEAGRICWIAPGERKTAPHTILPPPHHPTESFTEGGAGLGSHVRRFSLLDASLLGLGLGLEPGMVTSSSR